MRLIGFSGRMGAGKDTAYRLLSGYSLRETKCRAVFHRVAFADPLKAAALEAFGGNASNYHGTLEQKSQIVHPWNVSGRQILQFLGTEMFRDTVSKLIPEIGSNFWVRRLEYEIRGYDPEIIQCVTDVRFQNEADWIVSQGGIVIQINRQGLPIGNGIESHRSEAGFILKEIYHEVENNGTTEEFLQNLLNVIEQYFNLYS